MPLKYTAEELRACVKGAILANNIDLLKLYPFTKEQWQALKENVEEVLYFFLLLS